MRGSVIYWGAGALGSTLLVVLLFVLADMATQLATVQSTSCPSGKAGDWCIPWEEVPAQGAIIIHKNQCTGVAKDGQFYSGTGCPE